MFLSARRMSEIEISRWWLRNSLRCISETDRS